MTVVDTTLAGTAFFAALNSSDECAHAAYPEVVETEWVAALIVQVMAEMHRVMVDGIDAESLAAAAEHAFITVAGAGVALGKAIAAEELLDGFDAFDLDNVDWGSLSEFTEGTTTPDTEEE